MDIPVKDIPKDQMDKILYGSNGEKIHFIMKMNLASPRKLFNLKGS